VKGAGDMERKEIDYFEYYPQMIKALTSHGLLLAAYDKAGKANAMTIGWCTLGVVWSRPMCIVLVRPSRYTYQCIEHSGCFTVNVPPASLAKACEICGTKSGRDYDKLADAGLEIEQARTVKAPVIAQCPLVYECTVVHHNDVIPAELTEEIAQEYYPRGDYHRVYFGKILTTLAADDVQKLLG